MLNSVQSRRRDFLLPPTYTVAKMECRACGRGNWQAALRCIEVFVPLALARADSRSLIRRDTSCSFEPRELRRRSLPEIISNRVRSEPLPLARCPSLSHCTVSGVPRGDLSVLTKAATASICDLLRLCATGLMMAAASGTVGFRPRSLSQLLSVLIM
jgi:hypothetical protein